MGPSPAPLVLSPSAPTVGNARPIVSRLQPVCGGGLGGVLAGAHPRLSVGDAALGPLFEVGSVKLLGLSSFMRDMYSQGLSWLFSHKEKAFFSPFTHCMICGCLCGLLEVSFAPGPVV